MGKNKLNNLTHCFLVLGFFEIIDLVWKPKSSQAKWKEKTANFFYTLPWTKAEVKDICHTLLDLEWSSVGFLDLAILVLRVVWECRCNIKHQLMLETSYLVMETHANSTPVQVHATCMCLPKGKAKKHGLCQKSCQGFGQLFGKWRLFGRPFFKTNPQELSTLCIYPKQLLNNTKNVSIKNTAYPKSCPQFLSCNLWGASHEQPWPRSCSVLEIMQWKEIYQLSYRTWWGMLFKGIFLSTFSWIEPIHAMTYECYTCYKISIYSETNCGRYADDLRLPKDKAKEHGHCQ